MSTTTTNTLTGFETRCPNCAAAISFNPEDVIITCDYCGSIVNQKGETIPNHFMLPNNMSSDDIIPMIQKWLPARSRIKKDSIVLSSVRPLLIPYWAIQVSAQSHFSGYERGTDYREERRTRRVTDANGKTRTETYTVQIPVPVYRPIERDINENRRRVLLSRQGALFFGQVNLEKVLDQEIEKAQPFNIDMVKDLGKEVKFLSGEIEESDAREIVVSTVRADHRAQAHKATTELFDCRTQVNLGEAYFVHYPFWLVEFTYEGKSYRVAFDGFQKVILKGETPITSFTRVLNFSLTIISALIGSLVLFYMDYQYSASTSSNGTYIWGSVIIGILFYVLSVFFYSRFYRITGIKTS